MTPSSEGARPSLSLPARALLLAGPTAVGKSELAVALAERLDGEIISVDTMQVYRGLDIGTAKPSSELRKRIAHHLIDVAEPQRTIRRGAVREARAHRPATDPGARAHPYLVRRHRSLFQGPHRWSG